MKQGPYISIVMPALNEEANISPAMESTLKAFADNGISGEIVVINDGSTDKTASIVKEMVRKRPDEVRLIEHATPQGIGASFWDGVLAAKGEIVCMLPGDNENEPSEILRYVKLLNDVDMVIPFIYNRWVRPAFRNLLSLVYRLIINSTFGVNLNYTNGTVLYRKSILIDTTYRSKSFFFQTDILIRLIKKGYLFAEVPYRLGLRGSGKSKAVSFPSFWRVIKGYMRLVRDIYFTSGAKTGAGSFSKDSSSLKRYSDQVKEKA